MNGRAPRPATELMLTMRPRAALRRGRKACVTATAPTRFTSKTWRSWSRGTSSRGPADGMPALLTSAASGAPASARVTSSRARAMLAVSVTSISTGTTRAASSGAQSCSRRTVPNTRKPRARSEEHTSELQSQSNLVCRLLLEKKKKNNQSTDQLLALQFLADTQGHDPGLDGLYPPDPRH